MKEDYQMQILEALQEKDFGLTQRELSEGVGIARPTVRKYCKELLRAGEIDVIEKLVR